VIDAEKRTTLAAANLLQERLRLIERDAIMLAKECTTMRLWLDVTLHKMSTSKSPTKMR
jgi:hypothetical protein